MKMRVDLNAPIPWDLTPERTIFIYTKAIKAHLKKLNELAQNAFQDGYDESEVMKKSERWETISAK